MISPDYLDMIGLLLRKELGLSEVDSSPTVTVVNGRTFVFQFSCSLKVWYRLSPFGLERVTEVTTDAFDFCTGPSGSCYDWTDGRVKLVEYVWPPVVFIAGAWEED
jgi:hypothetical protein